MMIPLIKLPMVVVEPNENRAATKMLTPLKTPDSEPGSNGQMTTSVKAMTKMRIMWYVGCAQS